MQEDSGAINTDSGAGSDQGDVAALKKHADKVLSEKKKLAQELSDMKAKFEAIEQEKLESQGKLKELNENLKKQLAEANEKFKSSVQNFGSKMLKNSFEQEAQKAGCVDPDALYKLVNFENVEIAEDFSFNQEQLKSVISDAQKSRGYLFKKDATPAKDVTPNNKQQTNAPTDIYKMKPEELTQLLMKKLS